MKKISSNQFEFFRIENSKGIKTKTEVRASGIPAIISSMVVSSEALGTHKKVFLLDILSRTIKKLLQLKRNYFLLWILDNQNYLQYQQLMN